MTTRRAFVQQTAALAGLGLPFAGMAQAMPELAKIICGFPPGGTSDAMSRRLADKLRGNYATNVVVDNKPGAGGQIGVTTLRDSPADGTTMLLTPSSMLSIYPFVYKNLPYKPAEDVQPVSVACYFNHAFGVGPAVPASVRTVKDFLAWAKDNPTKANYGSPGAGSMPHLIVALLNKQTGSDLKHIPYRGSAPGIQDLLGGQISAMSSPVGDYLPYLASGRLRLLAISGEKRSPFVPDVATYRDQGHPITVREWYGVFLPGKASAATAQRASAAIAAALAQKDMIDSLATLGMEAQSSTPQVLGGLLRADADEWRQIISQVGFTADS